MKQSALKTFTPLVGLYALPGLANRNDKINHLINSAWLFAYSVLWNNMIFSKGEIADSKKHIGEWLKGRNTEKAFVNLCQRIILARLNVKSLNSDFLSLPSLWFDPENPEGFAVIKEWLDEIRTIRRSLPGFKVELKALSEAVLEFSGEPTSENYEYWRNYFIEKQEPVLLNLFTVFVANQTFDYQ
ncbi:MAG: hypothetical protein ABI675_15065 [Chitinophagaceae bacterium]